MTFTRTHRDSLILSRYGGVNVNPDRFQHFAHRIHQQGVGHFPSVNGEPVADRAKVILVFVSNHVDVALHLVKVRVGRTSTVHG